MRKSFINLPPRKKINKVSFITQHICLSAFCNTPSLNSSSREGSVNIVELNVNSSSFTVFLTASTTSQTTSNLTKVSSLFLVFVPVCMHECVRVRENERWIERERERERSELFKPSPAVPYPSDLCLCYFPLLNTK